MLDINNITIGYKGTPILEDISVRLPQGHLVALLGRNGAGKSTLMRAISGLGEIFNGEIKIDGKNIRSINRATISRTVSFVGTERVRISNLKCRDLVALGRAPYTNWIGQTTAEDDAVIEESLALVGMSDYAERSMDSMSDGECQKIMIARALAQDTPVMLLDEPTAFLDIPGRYSVVSLLHELAHTQNKTIIFSTHDLDIALEQSDDILLLNPPGIIFGTSAEIIESSAIQRVFNIENTNIKQLKHN